MEEQPEPIDDRTKINLSISSWWHVLVIVVVIAGTFFNLRAELTSTKAQSEKNAVDLVETQKALFEVKMYMQSISDNVKYFREQYDRDMSKYIRDPGDKSH